MAEEDINFKFLKPISSPGGFSGLIDNIADELAGNGLLVVKMGTINVNHGTLHGGASTVEFALRALLDQLVNVTFSLMCGLRERGLGSRWLGSVPFWGTFSLLSEGRLLGNGPWLHFFDFSFFCGNWRVDRLPDVLLRGLRRLGSLSHCLVFEVDSLTVSRNSPLAKP